MLNQAELDKKKTINNDIVVSFAPGVQTTVIPASLSHFSSLDWFEGMFPIVQGPLIQPCGLHGTEDVNTDSSCQPDVLHTVYTGCVKHQFVTVFFSLEMMRL